MTSITEWLMSLSNSTASTNEDSERMEILLHRIGFPEARVVCGIVYLMGHGTLDAPPMSIHTIAKAIATAWCKTIKEE
jgi:hypothetical protein